MTDDKAIIKQSLTATEFKNTRNDLVKFIQGQLKEAKNIGAGDSGDYGVIPFTKKKSLLKPGAEKLLKLFGFSASYELIKEIEDWDKRFIYYRYKCTITHGASGTFIADAIRSCNSKEKKHQTKDVYDVANTIESIAQKRALVAATVQATMASEIFDADVSESDDVAPNKGVTREEDPRRNHLFSSLYAKASQRGLDDKWLHKAAIKKFKIEESLTELSNSQIEELTEIVLDYYLEVPKGEKPRLKTTPITAEEKSDDVVDGEIVDDTKPLENEETVDLDEVDKALPDKDPLAETSTVGYTSNIESVNGESVEKIAEAVFSRAPDDCGNDNCKKGDNGIRAKADPEHHGFCSEECREEYYPDLKKKDKYGFNKTEEKENASLPEQTV